MTNFSTLNVNSNCDVSTIFAGGGPPDAGAMVKVGGKQLIPSPFINLSLEKYKVGELTIGGVLKLTLNGTVTGSSFNEVVTTGAGGATGLKDILQIGHHKECVYVEVKCNDSIVKGYGRVTSLNISEGNMPAWVNMAPYTIDIDLYTNDIGLSGVPTLKPAAPGQIETFGSSSTILNNLMLRSISESFSININEEAFNFVDGLYPTTMSAWTNFGGWGNRHIKVNFNISAAGIRALNCEDGSETSFNDGYGLKAAELYIKDRINKLRDMDVSLLFGPPNTELTSAFTEFRNGNRFLDFRTIEVNPLEDSLSLNGEIIYRPSSCNSYYEDNVFTSINIEQNIDAEGTTFTINGNIQGLVNNSYDNIIKMATSPTNWSITNCSSYQGKIHNAELFLSQFAKLDNLTSLANHYYKDGLIDENKKGYLEDNCPSSAGAGSDPCSSASPSPSPTTPELCDLRLSSSQINRNLPEGVINFTFVLSNKANCNILGAKKVDVEVTHDIPHDNIVEILIPGRGDQGVITQNLCCKSVEKYDASVNIVLNRNNCNNSMPSGTLANLRTCAEQILKDKLDPSVVDCWFITNHQETDGNNSYRLNKTYVKPSC